MLHATCDAPDCGKPIRQAVTGDAVLVQLEAPEVTIDDDGEEVEEGGKYLELRVVDGDGEPIGEHLCLDCAVFAIASSREPGDDSDDDDEGGGSEEPDPVVPASEKKKGK